MNLQPYIDQERASRYSITAFSGYNNNERCSEAEGYDEQNISSDYYPLFTPREPRVVVKSAEGLKGLHVNEGLIEIKTDDGIGSLFGIDYLYYEGTKIGTLPGTGKRQMVSMGAYVIIYPDKYRFNVKTRTLEPLGATFQTLGTVSFSLCTFDGTTISPTVSSSAPSNPSNGQYWIDTSTTPNELKQWSQTQGIWNAIASSYVKISATGIGSNFNKLDVVKISGVTGTYADTFNTDMALWDVSANAIVVTALINNVFNNSGITIQRTPPDLDFVCEHNNRLWGCNSSKHEIYACKLGDPTNWTSYLGTAADAFAVTVGSDGDFTGCAEHGGSVVFFKERYIHKMYGTAPSNFQLDTKPERGVKAGCHDSITLISGILYYLSVDGIVRYEGSYPVLISNNLGRVHYEDATAGAENGKYYVSMSDGTTRKLITYDTENGIWHIEDKGKDFKFFVNYKNRLLFYDADRKIILAEGKETKIGSGTYTLDTEPVEWVRIFGISGIDTPSSSKSYIDPMNKYISQFVLRFALETGGELYLDIEYDSSGDFENVLHIKSEYEVSRRDTPGYKQLRSLEVPVIPKRCDHMRLRLRGSGYVKVFSISKKIEGGGL